LKELYKQLSRLSEVHLILDFDGTLIPIRDNRDDLSLPLPTLRALKAITNLPVTILSGRDDEDLKTAFQDFSFQLVARNGFEESATLNQQGVQVRLRLSELLPQTEVAATLIEAKGAMTSLHFRHLKNDNLGPVLLELVSRTIKELGLESGWHAYLGKMVVNVEPRAVSKAKFVADYLAKNTHASVLFAGDDSNDFPVFELNHPRLTRVFVYPSDSPSALQWSDVKKMPREDFLELLEQLGQRS